MGGARGGRAGGAMTRTVARGVLNVTGGCKYPSGYWLAAPDGATIPGDCPAVFREAAGREWVEWVAGERERWYAGLDSGAPPEWNRRGIASPLASRAGGAWAGPAHVVQSLVSEELAQYWTECAPRLNRTEYIAHAWAETERMRQDMETREIASVAGELATVPGVAGQRGAYAGALWEHDGAAWVRIADTVPAGGIDAAAAALRESGALTAAMVDLIVTTYRDGATGRKGRVIAPAGDWAAAVARGAGVVAPDSRRGRAVAAAADCIAAAAYPELEPAAPGTVSAWDCEPF